jgi:hypothetical protein
MLTESYGNFGLALTLGACEKGYEALVARCVD